MPDPVADGPIGAPGPDVSWVLATWLAPVMVVVIGVLFVAIASVVDGGRAWWVGMGVVFALAGLALARGSGHPRRAGAGVAMVVAGVLTLFVNLLSVLG